MSRRSYVYRFQAIQVAYKDKPLRVLEERLLPAGDCTLESAKVMLMTRLEDKNYSRKHGALWPDAVRFVDEGGAEVVRYTAWNYLRELTREEAGHGEVCGGPAVDEVT